MKVATDIKKLGTGIRVKMKGDMTIENLVDVKKEILKALPKNGNVTLFLKEIEKIDIAGLQMVMALQKQLHDSNNSLTIFWPDNKEIKQSLEKLGFVSLAAI